MKRKSENIGPMKTMVLPWVLFVLSSYAIFLNWYQTPSQHGQLITRENDKRQGNSPHQSGEQHGYAPHKETKEATHLSSQKVCSRVHYTQLIPCTACPKAGQSESHPPGCISFHNSQQNMEEEAFFCPCCKVAFCINLVVYLVLRYRNHKKRKTAPAPKPHPSILNSTGYVVTPDYYKPQSTCFVWIEVQKDGVNDKDTSRWYLMPSSSCPGCRAEVTDNSSSGQVTVPVSTGQDIELAKIKIISAPQPNSMCHAICVLLKNEEDVQVLLENMPNIEMKSTVLVNNTQSVQRVQNVLLDISRRIAKAHRKAVKSGKSSVPLYEYKEPVKGSNNAANTDRLSNAEKIWQSIHIIPGNSPTCNQDDKGVQLITANYEEPVQEEPKEQTETTISDRDKATKQPKENAGTRRMEYQPTENSHIETTSNVMAFRFSCWMQNEIHDLLRRRRRQASQRVEEVIRELSNSYCRRMYQYLWLYSILSIFIYIPKKKPEQCIRKYYNWKAKRELQNLRNRYLG